MSFRNAREYADFMEGVSSPPPTERSHDTGIEGCGGEVYPISLNSRICAASVLGEEETERTPVMTVNADIETTCGEFCRALGIDSSKWPVLMGSALEGKESELKDDRQMPLEYWLRKKRFGGLHALPECFDGTGIRVEIVSRWGF